MKLEYTIPTEEENEMTYKKFLRIVHKQIASANAGFPNSKIIALVGAAWKDYKAEMIDKDTGIGIFSNCSLTFNISLLNGKAHKCILLYYFNVRQFYSSKGECCLHSMESHVLN